MTLRIPVRLMREPSQAGARGSAGGCGAAPLDFETARTSFSVTRPSGPVPFTVERSTPCSAASRRARGDAFTRASPLLSARGSGAGLEGGAVFFSAGFFFPGFLVFCGGGDSRFFFFWGGRAFFFFPFLFLFCAFFFCLSCVP